MFTARRELNHRVQELRRIPFLAECSCGELARIDRLGTPVIVEPGRTLTREGAVGRQVFVTLDGLAIVERGGQPIGAIGGGSIAGEMAFLDHTRRNATVVASTPMRLLVFNDREFRALLAIAPGVEACLAEIAEKRRAPQAARIRASRLGLPAPPNCPHSFAPDGAVAQITRPK
jgi:CRP/FNR family transcriptional regulator, cyclic AMP receptor protein